MSKLLGVSILLFLLCAGDDAGADDGSLVIWDTKIASTLQEIILGAQECPHYAISADSNPACSTSHLSVRREKGLTDLDRFVLFVDRYANARFHQQLSDQARIDFRADVPDVVRMKADFKVQLKLEF